MDLFFQVSSSSSVGFQCQPTPKLGDLMESPINQPNWLEITQSQSQSKSKQVSVQYNNDTWQHATANTCRLTDKVVAKMVLDGLEPIKTMPDKPKMRKMAARVWILFTLSYKD